MGMCSVQQIYFQPDINLDRGVGQGDQVDLIPPSIWPRAARCKPTPRRFPDRVARRRLPYPDL
jgi:hypothetical protein